LLQNITTLKKIQQQQQQYNNNNIFTSFKAKLAQLNSLFTLQGFFNKIVQNPIKVQVLFHHPHYPPPSANHHSDLG
jgi:cell fate (sporulation/competence/biofilm development) regulator YlbF (YheA/YmcA/DUF963 family)